MCVWARKFCREGVSRTNRFIFGTARQVHPGQFSTQKKERKKKCSHSHRSDAKLVRKRDTLTLAVCETKKKKVLNEKEREKDVLIHVEHSPNNYPNSMPNCKCVA